jgi:hypothetical protein
LEDVVERPLCALRRQSYRSLAAPKVIEADIRTAAMIG